MGAIKKCGRCGEVRAHHSDVDDICMECERLQYYPDSDIIKGHIVVLEMSAAMDQSLNEFKESVESMEYPSFWQSIEYPSFWQSMKNMFKW